MQKEIINAQALKNLASTLSTIGENGE